MVRPRSICGIRLERCVVRMLLVSAAMLVGSLTIARADDLPKKPFFVSLGGFLLTDSVVTSQSAAGSLTVKYNFSSLGSRRQNEDGVGLFAAFAKAQVVDVDVDNSITILGIMYEHTWGFGSLYYAAGAGIIHTSVSNFGASGDVTDAAFDSRFGVYFDRRQSFGLEFASLAGGRPANTGVSIDLVGRF